MALIFLFRGGIMNQTHQRITYCCPTCGNTIGEAPAIDAVIASIGSFQQRAILKALTKKVGQPVGGEELMSALFGFRKLKPKYPRSVFQQTMADARQKIEEFGWTIVAKRAGRGGSVYRIIPTVAGAV